MQPKQPSLSRTQPYIPSSACHARLIAYLGLLGVMQGDGFILVLGLLLTLYFVFTFHRQYELYQDVLVVRYLAPRRMVVPLEQIAPTHR